MALEAIAAGKHVLVEKPIAMTVDEATAMIDAADAADVRLYVAENEPYTPMAECLREIVRSGEYIGELTAASVTGGFRAPDYGYPGRRAWLADPELGGTGTWMLHGIHTVARTRYILGEIATVYMISHRSASYRREDVEATMSGMLTLENGVPVSILQTSETRMSGDLGGYVLHGDQGSIRASSEEYTVFNDEHDGTVMPYPEETLSPYARELKAFAEFITTGEEGPTDGISERRSLAVVQAGYESATQGRPIDLRERFGNL